MKSSAAPLARSSRRALLLCAILAITVLTLPSCARDDATSANQTPRAAATRLLGPDEPASLGPWMGPAQHGGQGYPLAIGDAWTYSMQVTTTLVTDAGPQPPDVTQTPWVVTITGDAVLDQRHYFTQAEFDPRSPGSQALYYERQDRTGWFERDPAPATIAVGADRASRPPSPLAARLMSGVDRMPGTAAHRAAFRSAAASIAARMEWALHPALAGESNRMPIGPPPDEIALLRYPLHTGAAWLVRVTPRFERRVTGREPLEVPAGRYSAWRIALGSELYGPNDRAFIWYGGPGMLRLRSHAESAAVDDSGNIVGTLLVDFDQVLTSASLRRPESVATSAEAGAGP